MWIFGREGERRVRKGERGGKMSGKEEGFTPYRSITFVTPLEKKFRRELALSLFSNIFLFPPSQILCLFSLFLEPDAI